MSRLRVLLESRAKVHADLVAVLNGARTPDQREVSERMLANIESLSKDIEQINRANQAALEQRGLPNGSSVVPSEATRKAAEYRASYFDWLRNGEPGVHKSIVGRGARQESLNVLRKIESEIRSAQKEQRDQLAGTQSIVYTQGASGGYFVPAGFVYDIEQATKYFADLFNVVKTIKTDSGQVLPHPTSNDTNEAWHILGESSQILDQGTNQNYPTPGVLPTTDAGNVSLGHVNLNAWKGSTGLIRVSLELLQDSAFDLQEYLTERFAERLGRGYEAYLTNGSGVSQPLGILPAIASSGAVPITAAGSNPNDGLGGTGTNSIGYPDLVNLIHSVDPTYRRGAKFMFHDNTLAHLKTRLDKYGRPLWVPSVRESEPDTVAGYSYVINQSFPVIAASATVAAFGQWSKFVCRKVKELSILRLDERFADFGEVGFVGFSRIDSNLIDAGTHPLNTLQMHS
jgi:HK97 family phage major capsid protein